MGKPENREKTASGKWEPGVSGNPGGRPKRTTEELDLIAACKRKTRDALAVIERLMVESDNDRVRMDAALAIIERGYGKPMQPTSLTGSLDLACALEAARKRVSDYERSDECSPEL